MIAETIAKGLRSSVNYEASFCLGGLDSAFSIEPVSDKGENLPLPRVTFCRLVPESFGIA